MSSLFVIEWCEFAGRRGVSLLVMRGVSSLVIEWCELAGRRACLS